MFLVKCRVHALMKNVSNNVDVHLNQRDGDLIYFKCRIQTLEGRTCSKHLC